MAKNQPLFNLILRGVAVAMGVAAVVLNILQAADASALITLLGIGLFAIGVDALNRG